MPKLVSPVCAPGSLANSPQPAIPLASLTLRPWRTEDRPTLLTAFAEPDIQLWHRLSLESVAEAEEWVTSWVLRWAAEEAASWAITLGAQVLGQVGLRGVDLAEGYAELSYWVLPEARGQGVAARATEALADWAFDVVGLHRLEIGHSVRNTASCAVARRLGFPLEGTKKSAYLHADGWHDAHLHARVKPAAR
ncbi:GNAT family N-acetyltransferase [Allokutzneria sp. A3M-2-11 16]|uniref:GNAT family N-acetyltransferase n=1 Tax=Allokutzneria sp. A3M-2-11 16 TaxID=2962043 RepID=UPI0020B8F265|nr:GNAT family N-acetyltransferase [Allokutzneria sp. A3M-2-11 16]MCP3805268.1 GNAT family N-acetyltransferase [Allokutzneria sp. A3M-2-11 16]